MGDRLVVTDRIEVQLHALGGFARKGYAPMNIQETLDEQDVTPFEPLRDPGDGPNGHASVRPSALRVNLTPLCFYIVSPG